MGRRKKKGQGRRGNSLKKRRRTREGKEEGGKRKMERGDTHLVASHLPTPSLIHQDQFGDVSSHISL